MACVINGSRPLIPTTRSCGDASGGGGSLVPLPVSRIIEVCWAQDMHQRPSFLQVVRALEAVADVLQMNQDV
jgi:hypothetical protein